MEEIALNRTPIMMQLYAVLDDPEHASRDDVTQFVMEARDTLVDAIDFMNETVAPQLWGVSRVELVGIVPLNSCDNRSIKARKVLASFPLERIFVQGHQDCLVVTPEHHLDGSVHTEASTDYPTSATGRIHYLLGGDPGSETTTDEASVTEQDGDEFTTDEEQFNKSLPAHLRSSAGTSMISMADTEAESTTPLTGEEPTDTEASPPATPDKTPAETGTDNNDADKESNQESATVNDSGNRPKKEEDGARELPTGMDNTDALPSLSESTTPLETMMGANKNDENPSASISDEGHSIGFAYDVPIQSDDGEYDDDADDDVEPTAPDLPPWANDDTDKEDKEKDESNAVAIAAGVVIGTATTGGITAAVLASQSDDKVESSVGDAAMTSEKASRAAPFPESADRVSAAGSDLSDAAVPKDTGARTSVRAGPRVAEMLALFDKKDSSPPTNETLNDIPTAKSEDPNEVHLLDGFTTEEDDDDLFKPEIPRNLKATCGGNGGYRRGDSEFDGLAEREESVKTMEFPGSDDDMPTAASFDNVVVVDLPDSSSEGNKGVDNAEAVQASAPKVEANALDTPTDNEDAASNFRAVPSPTKKEDDEPSTPLPTKRTANAKTGNVSARENDAQVNENDVLAATKSDTIPVKTNDTVESEPLIPTATDGGFNASSETDEGFDSWRTDDTHDDDASNSFLPAKDVATKQKKSRKEPKDGAMTFPSLLGNSAAMDWENNSDTEGEPLLLDQKPSESIAAAPLVATQEKKIPTMSYKIGSTYFLLRERDDIEYPVKILSLGKRGTCIVEYEHHRAKKKIRTSSLLPDTPERRQKFDEQLKTGQIAKDLPDRISKELKQKQTERHARHEERRRYGHQISRDDLPTCSTEGTILDFKSRRVYFAKDKETVREIGKKFNVPTDRIIYDNKIAYPTLKKTSRLRPLTSIVLPPAS